MNKDRPIGIEKLVCTKCGYLIRDGLGSLQSKVVDGMVMHIKCPTQKVVTELDRPDREKIAKRVKTLMEEGCWIDKEALEQAFICPNTDCFECFSQHGIIDLFPDKKDGYSISTIVDVENDAYKAGEKQERNRILGMMNKRDVGGVNPEWALDDRRYQDLKRGTE